MFRVSSSLKRYLVVATMLVFVFPLGARAQVKLGSVEKTELVNHLVQLYRNGGGEKEIERIKQVLQENGFSSPELEKDRLIFKVARHYAERLSFLRSQSRYNAVLAEARGLGLTDSELGLELPGELNAVEEMAIAENLVRSADEWEAGRLAWRLGARPLRNETQQVVLDAIRVSASPSSLSWKRLALLSALKNTESELLEGTLEEWASDDRNDAELRGIARTRMIEMCGVEGKWQKLISIARDSGLPDEERTMAITALMGGEKRGDPTTRAVFLEIAESSKESPDIRWTAIIALGKLSETEVKLVEDMVNDVEVPPRLRLCALLALNEFKGVVPGDETWLKYLANDPSLAFRKLLADVLPGPGPFRAGDAVRKAVEAVQAEVARDRENSKGALSTQHKPGESGPVR